jgi:hypothetical protein
MTSKTWIGGHAGNAAGSAANWSPTGAPQPGDNLTVVTGTLEIGGRLAGDTLHLNDPGVAVGPVTLDLNGNANISIDGFLQAGNTLTVNVSGTDHLDATNGFATGSNQRGGTFNLAANSHLYVTGSMSFGYGGLVTGGHGAVLTNNGTLMLGASTIGTGVTGAVATTVNGTGTLVFRGYHSGGGTAEISSKIASTQHVELNPGDNGLTMILSDPKVHALLSVDPVVNRGVVSVVLQGVTADDFTLGDGGTVMLTKGGHAVDTLRVNNVAGAFATTAAFGADSTTITFATHTPQTISLGGSLNGSGGITA